jgi:serine/threonine-protein kinase
MTDPVERLNAALEGRYRIDRELGEGGMATVYLADDLRHERKVALKVLKPELAAVVGGDRFLAEIKTTANLQHPHILPLFDSGEEDGFLFYVMPYVEGETLRDRVDREKQLPVDEAVGIAVAVASALEYAHEHGVVHRDIKPANIMMQAGQPVVGDFGIALAVGSAGGARLTETGLSVGTPYYMSPEQATGDQQVGPAADVYALGAVLYELLTGDPPYTGSTAQAVLGKIIQGVPVSASAVRRTIPPNVDAAIRKALEKLPADRFTGAHEFSKALGTPSFRHGEDESVVAAAASAGSWRTAAILAAAVAVLLGGTTIWALNRPDPIRPVERFANPFLPDQVLGYMGPAGFDLSPDGTMLVYRHDLDMGQVLMIRRWDELSATPVRDTEGGQTPAISPDGLELAFEAGDEVRVLALAGGPVRTLATGEDPEWGPDGYVYISTESGLIRVPSAGGAPEALTELADDEQGHRLGDVLPGGTTALVLSGRNDGSSSILGLDLESGETTVVLDGVRNRRPRYLSSGHLVYGASEAGTLMAARFDLGKMELESTPVAVLDGLLMWSLAHDGKLFYTAGTSFGASPTLQLLWVDRTGQSTPVDPGWTFQRGVDPNQGWSLSPDGSMVALRERTEDGYDVWIKQLDTGPRSRLTFGESEERMPVWSPGGSNVTFLSDRNGNHDVWSKPANGTRDAELLLDIEQDIATVHWSPDGEWLLVRTSTGSGPEDVRTVLAFRPGTDSVPAPLLVAEDYNHISPAISPDGRWLAYASNETGRFEIYVRPFPDVSAGRWQVSIDGGRTPKWAHSGRELFFQDPDENMMVVEVEADAEFRSTPPLRLFAAVNPWLGINLTGVLYDVAPDDERFLIGTLSDLAGAEGEPAPAVLVNNFGQELERLVPR